MLRAVSARNIPARVGLGRDDDEEVAMVLLQSEYYEGRKAFEE
jgi:hypothetical protein